MPQLAVQGALLHYQSLGEGRPVIMIHGLLLGNMATWYFGIASELAKTKSVHLYDLRGHGMSSQVKEGYELKTMVDDLEALADRLELDEFAIVGHSYGALVALHFALRHPQKVNRLILVEGPLPPARGLEIEDFMAKSEQQMVEALPTELQSLMQKPTRQAKKLMERIGFLIGDTDLLANLKCERDITPEELNSLKMPVQLIYGSRSKLVDVARRLQDGIPHSHFALLEGGHYLPSELPAETGRIIGDFLQ